MLKIGSWVEELTMTRVNCELEVELSLLPSTGQVEHLSKTQYPFFSISL